MNTYAIILAAGEGKRMQSHLPKVLHHVGNMSMVEHLVNKLEYMNVDEIFVVIGHKGELIKAHLGSRVTYVVQHKQYGTAHAVRQAAPLLKDKQGQTLVLMGDTPLIDTQTMENLIIIQRNTQCFGVVLTTLLDDPTGYGRVIRDERTGKVIGIVEDKDADMEQKRIREVNTGIYCFDNRCLFELLPNIQNNNAQQEYYLTDLVHEMRKAGETMNRTAIESLTLTDPTEVMGINDRHQLAIVERIYNERMKIN